MSTLGFQLDRNAGGQLGARGRLTFETAAAALAAINRALAATPTAELDLAGIEHSDSAGLACVLAAQAHAARLGRPLALRNMPPNMHALAQVCEVDALATG